MRYYIKSKSERERCYIFLCYREIEVSHMRWGKWTGGTGTHSDAAKSFFKIKKIK